MNRATARKQAEIKLAWANKQQIQFRPLYHEADWEDAIGDDVKFDFDSWAFRVKPKPRKFWIVEWPTRWHVFTSLDCAIASSRKQVDDTPGVVIEVVEVLP